MRKHILTVGAVVVGLAVVGVSAVVGISGKPPTIETTLDVIQPLLQIHPTCKECGLKKYEVPRYGFRFARCYQCEPEYFRSVTPSP